MKYPALLPRRSVPVSARSRIATAGKVSALTKASRKGPKTSRVQWENPTRKRHVLFEFQWENFIYNITRFFWWKLSRHRVLHRNIIDRIGLIFQRRFDDTGRFYEGWLVLVLRTLQTANQKIQVKPQKLDMSIGESNGWLVATRVCRKTTVNQILPRNQVDFKKYDCNEVWSEVWKVASNYTCHTSVDMELNHDLQLIMLVGQMLILPTRKSWPRVKPSLFHIHYL